MVAFAKVIQAGFGIAFFAGELVVPHASWSAHVARRIIEVFH